MFCYEQVQSCLFRHWFPPPEPWSFLCCSLFLRSQIIWNEEIKRGLVTTDVNRCFLKKLLCSTLHRFSFDQLAAFWQPISTSLVRQFLIHVHKTEPRPQRLISHKLQLRESIRDITEQIRAKYTKPKYIAHEFYALMKYDLSRKNYEEVTSQRNEQRRSRGRKLNSTNINIVTIKVKFAKRKTNKWAHRLFCRSIFSF